MSVVYLQPDDFYVNQNNDLAHKLPKFSLVFFNSANCVYCKDVLPAFAAVSSTIKGCTFAMMDVYQDNMRVVRMAERTKTPIAYVPYVIMYVNGNPLAIFNPDEDNPQANYNLLKKFIVDNANAARNGRSPAIMNVAHTDNKVCATSIGMALCGGKKNRVCYLKTGDAYTNK